MCGVIGTINYKLNIPEKEVYESLLHRGPDEQNFLSQDNVDLYHLRLAIQDLTPGGRQPMVKDGIYISYNGEIYNHAELREKYNVSGTSLSDTETILLLYQKIGMKMLEEFDGMFVFCLYDSNTKKAFLARDRAGKKPLYIWEKDDRYVFASELNTISNLIKPEIDRQAISEYLYFGYNWGAQTCYQHIQELEAGTYWEIDLNARKKTIVKWFDIEKYYAIRNDLNLDDSITLVDGILTKSVLTRISSSDLEVGAFLSGGIDSGLVTAIGAQATKNFKTFTVRMQGNYDESSLAELVARRYNTNHTVIDISFDNLQNDFEKIIGNYGEPFFDSSAIPSYYVSKAAKDHITVVLNGDGADEIFGGYRRYVPFSKRDLFNVSGPVHTLSKALLNFLPSANDKKGKYSHIYRLIHLLSYSRPIEIYNATTIDLLVGFEKEFLRGTSFKRAENILNPIAANGQYSGLQKMLVADFKALLFSDLLVKMDIATMAHSLEGRSPFLSKGMLEHIPSLPDEHKIKGTTTKFILRQLAKKYLPEELISQPKRGFEVPLKQWINGELSDILHSYLSSANSYYAEYLDKQLIEKIYTRKLKMSEERRAKILYSILCLEIWKKNRQ